MVRKPGQRHATRFPAGTCDMAEARGFGRSLAGIRAGGFDPGDLPGSASFQWHVHRD